VLLSQSYRTPHGAVIDEYRAHFGMITSRRKPKNSEKNLPDATMSTTNPTWTYLGPNTGHRGERPATNRLSRDTPVQSQITSVEISGGVSVT
jgi:hypothetical protein